MRRREFIALVGGSSAAWPLGVWAQQTTGPVVGFLHGGTAAGRTRLVAAFVQGLNGNGFAEGKNLSIEYRWADDQPDRVPGLAQDLVNRRVAVIAAVGGEHTVFACKAATSSIPIVFIAGGDPVKAGLVASFARPGANITGVNMFSVELQAKRLGVLHELVQQGLGIAYFFDPNFPPAEPMIAAVETAARSLGRQIRLLKTASETDIDEAFATIAQAGVGGLLAGTGPFFNSRRNQIIALAARHSIPAMYEFRDSVAAGGLISYGTSLEDAFRQAGDYTGRILNGESPADMPVLQPTKFQLAINLKTAKSLRLTIPSGMLATADEVIE